MSSHCAIQVSRPAIAIRSSCPSMCTNAVSMLNRDPNPNHPAPCYAKSNSRYSKHSPRNKPILSSRTRIPPTATTTQTPLMPKLVAPRSRARNHKVRITRDDIILRPGRTSRPTELTLRRSTPLTRSRLPLRVDASLTYGREIAVVGVGG